VILMLIAGVPIVRWAPAGAGTGTDLRRQ